MNQSAYIKAKVALRNKALKSYARDRNISYGCALKRENYILTTYEPYLSGLKELEENFKRYSSGTNKHSGTGEKDIMEHIKKKKEEYQMKALKKREEKQNRLNVSLQDKSSMASLAAPDLNVRGNENSEVQKIDGNEKESAFLNVLKMYSKNSIEETIIIDDDEEAIVTEIESDNSIEKSNQNEINQENQSSATNYYNVNTGGLHHKTNIDNKEDWSKKVLGAIPGNHRPNIEPFKNTDIAKKCTETIQIRNVGQVIDFLKSRKDNLLDSSTNINSKTHDMTTNMPHHIHCTTNRKPFKRNSSEPPLRKNPDKQKVSKSHKLKKVKNVRKQKSCIIDQSTNKASLLENKSTPINNHTDKSNRGVLTNQVDQPAYLSEPVNNLDPNDALEDKFWLRKMKQKISELAKLNNSNKYTASFQKQSEENYHNSQPSAPNYYNYHGQNNLQRPYMNKISGYKEYTPEKQLYNETQTTKTSIDQLNTINHSNLAKNYTTNYENYFTRNNINYTVPNKEKTSMSQVHPTSPAHNDLREIYKIIFDNKCNQEGKDHRDAGSLVDMLNYVDFFMPTEMKEVTSNEKQCINSIKGIEEIHLPTEQFKTHPEIACEKVVETNIETEYIKLVDKEMLETNSKTGSTVTIDVEMIDTDSVTVNRPDVVMIEATVDTGPTRAGVGEVETNTEKTGRETRNDMEITETNLDAQPESRPKMSMFQTIRENGKVSYELTKEKIQGSIAGALDTIMKQNNNDEEYEQLHSEDLKSDVHEEIFYDDVFISNVKPPVYKYCLLA